MTAELGAQWRPIETDPRRRGQQDGYNGKKRPRRAAFEYHMGYEEGLKMRQERPTTPPDPATGPDGDET